MFKTFYQVQYDKFVIKELQINDINNSKLYNYEILKELYNNMVDIYNQSKYDYIVNYEDYQDDSLRDLKKIIIIDGKDTNIDEFYDNIIIHFQQYIEEYKFLENKYNKLQNKTIL